jgi:hypothetical protein
MSLLQRAHSCSCLGGGVGCSRHVAVIEYLRDFSSGLGISCGCCVKNAGLKAVVAVSSGQQAALQDRSTVSVSVV